MTLQQIFIANLKRIRNERGFSQMQLSEKCDMNCNYIGQIEMGRRIPSFEKIEKIALALETPSHILFAYESAESRVREESGTPDYLRRLPKDARKEIITRLSAAISRDIKDSFDPENY
ncbi:MAG: helix-turn-helix domain-containing protein [Spirochaetota bacterium]|jgi:transcriptional regulator with XRE-family HTH domain|nr:helix-turn-helix domain-containing protein [Spirochaetota bacterium]